MHRAGAALDQASVVTGSSYRSRMGERVRLPRHQNKPAGSQRRGERAQLVRLLQGPGSFSTARGSAQWTVGEQASSRGGLRPPLTFGPRLALHGQGLETQLISPAALFPATLSGRVRGISAQRSHPLPVGQCPGARGGPPRHSRETSVPGEFKRPRDLSSVSVDLPNWLQHAGAAGSVRPAGGCPRRRGLRGVRAWAEAGRSDGRRGGLDLSPRLGDGQTHSGRQADRDQG